MPARAARTAGRIVLTVATAAINLWAAMANFLRARFVLGKKRVSHTMIYPSVFLALAVSVLVLGL